jgi:hypothetical protein
MSNVASVPSPARAAALATALTAAVACSSSPPSGVPADPGALVAQGKHVTLYYHPDAVPCAGTVPFLDTNVEAIAAYLGQPLGTPIPYHFRQDLPCTPEALGCTMSGDAIRPTIWAKTPFSIHELVHAVQLGQAPLSVSFLMEGQAVSLGEPTFNGGPANLTDSDLLAADPLPGNDYPIAGDFVAYLFTRFGAGPYEKLLATAPRGTAPDQVEAAFQSTYGETMGALRTDFAASSVRFLEDRTGFSECQALPPDGAIGSGTPASESLDCATNGVGTEGQSMFRDIPFDVPNGGIYAVDVAAPAGTTTVAYFTGCGKTTWMTFGETGRVPANALVLAHLPKGRYYVAIAAPAQAATSFGIRVTPVGISMSPQCASTPVVQVPASIAHLVVFSMDDEVLEVPFQIAAVASAVGWSGFVSPADVCLAGCDQGCVNTQSPPAPMLSPGNTYVLRAHLSSPVRYAVVDLQR